MRLLTKCIRIQVKASSHRILLIPNRLTTRMVEILLKQMLTLYCSSQIHVGAIGVSLAVVTVSRCLFCRL